MLQYLLNINICYYLLHNDDKNILKKTYLENIQYTTPTAKPQAKQKYSLDSGVNMDDLNLYNVLYYLIRVGKGNIQYDFRIFSELQSIPPPISNTKTQYNLCVEFEFNLKKYIFDPMFTLHNMI